MLINSNKYANISFKQKIQPLSKSNQSIQQNINNIVNNNPKNKKKSYGNTFIKWGIGAVIFDFLLANINRYRFKQPNIWAGSIKEAILRPIIVGILGGGLAVTHDIQMDEAMKKY